MSTQLRSYQHDFMSGHSCDTQLIQTTEDFWKTIDVKYQTDAVVLNFPKAFDMFPHRRLLHKLSKYSLNTRCVDWIWKWLRNRPQSVVMDGERPHSVPVRSGVPQGKCWDHCCSFLLYINDIGVGLSSTIKLFADDCLLYRRITTAKKTLTLQQNLDKLTKWSETWLMHFNTKKCSMMTITNKKNVFSPRQPYHMTLEKVLEASYLAVNITDNRSWKRQLNQISNKANTILNFRRCNLTHCKLSVRERAYLTLMRPILEYASSTWDPHYDGDMNSTEMCQRSAARFVIMYHSWSSIQSRTNARSNRIAHTREQTKVQQACVVLQRCEQELWTETAVPGYIHPSNCDPSKNTQTEPYYWYPPIQHLLTHCEGLEHHTTWMRCCQQLSYLKHSSSTSKSVWV